MAGKIWHTFSHPKPAPVGEVRTSVTVSGDVSGQLAVGSHIVQMRVDTVLGNLVTVLPPDAKANVSPRPVPISLVPRRPALVVGRQHETTLAVEALSGRRAVELYAPPGMGKSTLLRSLAHQLPITEACGGMAHLSARGLSHDDLLQVLFDVFYSCDIPVKPPLGELRHRLQHVRAALLLDDVDLSGDDIEDVEDYAPECGFLLTTQSDPGVSDALTIPLAGLRGADARELIAHALGRPVGPEEQPAVDALCDLVQGAPAGLLRLAAAARAHDGSLADFAATAASSGVPPLPVESAEEVRLLGLLAAIPGVNLDVRQLADLTGMDDVQARIDRMVARGLVVASAPPVSSGARVDYSLADGVDLGPAGVWQMSQRRAELRDYFLMLAEERSETLLAPGAPPETLRALHSDAAKRRDWRYVLGLGVLLDAAYALSGRWDAWRAVSEDMLVAARAVGDPGAEAMALHQLGTRALCEGQTSSATTLLQSALDLRTAIGDVAAAQVTQHNLSLIMAPPPPAPEDHEESLDHHDDASVYADDKGSSYAHSSGVDPGSSAAHVSSSGAHASSTGAHASSTGVQAGVGSSAISAPAVTVGASAVVVSALVAGVVLLQSGSDAAAVALDQRSLSFSPVALNQASESQTITARNLGGTPIHVDDFLKSGPNQSEFTVAKSNCRDREIAAGSTCTAEVVFTPTGAGPRAASVTVDVVELSTDPLVWLSGSSPGPDQTSPSAVPTELSFGEQPLNTAGERREVTLSGPPAGPVVLAPAAVDSLDGDFVIEGDGCSGAQLVPGSACTVGVRFAPGTEGPRQGALTVPRLDGMPPVAVPLSGTGAAPERDAAFDVRPRSVAFGEQPLSTSSRPQQVVLTNSGDLPLDVSPVSVMGAPDFTLGEAACPATLEAGEDCAASVVFTPVATGGRQAQLLFGGGRGPTVPLSGEGTAPDPAAPDVSPRALTFGDQFVGAAGPAQTVTVTNRADRPLRITPAPVTATTGSFRSDTSACTSSDIAPGASCAVSVTFAPTAAGTQSGILVLTAEGFPDAAVVLTGVGRDIRTPLVPSVIGMELTAARAELTATGFVTGDVTEVAHPDIPRGSVSDQIPRAGTPLDQGDAVDLYVSLGPPPVTVPELVGLTRAEAAQELRDADLRVGAVSQRKDPSAEPDTVLESNPPGGSEVAVGDPVDLVLVAETCTVPDVRRLSESAARERLADDDLTVGRVTDREDAGADAGSVLQTDPSAGAEVDCGSNVDLVIAVEPPCTVPDVRGMSEPGARERLGNDDLTVGRVADREDPSAEPGTVLETNPPAGAEVDCGSPVDLVLAEKTCTVPDVRGLTRDAAAAELRENDLTLGQVGDREDSSAAPGTVLQTNPPPGSKVDCGSPVDLVLAERTCTVPDVRGLTRDAAAAELRENDLTLGQVGDREDSSAAPGTVLQTNPPPGSKVDCGDPVDLVISPPTCVVPKLLGLTQKEATERLQEAGLTVGRVIESPDTRPAGQVAEISPGEGREVPCGSAVKLDISAPDSCPNEQPRNSDGSCPPTPVTCNPPQERDPATNTCKTPPCPNEQPRNSDGSCPPTPVTCNPPQERDPATNTCKTPPCPNEQPRNSDGSCPPTPVTCNPPQERDPATNTCKTPPCSGDQERNSDGSCPDPPVVQDPDSGLQVAALSTGLSRRSAVRSVRKAPPVGAVSIAAGLGSSPGSRPPRALPSSREAGNRRRRPRDGDQNLRRKGLGS